MSPSFTRIFTKGFQLAFYILAVSLLAASIDIQKFYMMLATR